MALFPKIYVAVPLMDELENVPQMLGCLQTQSYSNFEVVVCINQPDSWWNDLAKKIICEKNQETIQHLEHHKPANLTIIDRSSPGNGWNKKHFGVGWARKTAMDHISRIASPDDIILTLDGDTFFESEYFREVVQAFTSSPEIKALTIPYYHKLPENYPAARAILRYEIYMRHFALNMLRIGNPYAFTALGSAMACSVKTYRSIGGITPHQSGEDFYFIQKLRKFGPIQIWLDEKVYPAARFSDRVFFGTGPAMIRGNSGDWSGYPVYPFQYFDEIKATFDGFGQLFENDQELPMIPFLQEKFCENLWQPLRDNAKSEEQFIRACQHKVDGLRILQYLKWRHSGSKSTDEQNLAEFVKSHFSEDQFSKQMNWNAVDFERCSIQSLNEIRNYLAEKEDLWRKTIMILR